MCLSVYHYILILYYIFSYNILKLLIYEIEKVISNKRITF